MPFTTDTSPEEVSDATARDQRIRAVAEQQADGMTHEERLEWLCDHYPPCTRCGAPWTLRNNRPEWLKKGEADLLEGRVRERVRLFISFSADYPTGTVHASLCEECARRQYEDEQAQERVAQVRRLKEDLLADGLISHDMLAHTFEVSQHDVEARHPAVWEQSRNWRPKDGSVWIEGPTGTGKTWLAHAILNAVLNRGHRVGVVTGSSLNQLGIKERDRVLARLERAQVILIDDIHFPTWSTWGVEVLHDLLDRRHRSGKANIYTSNMSTAKWRQAKLWPMVRESGNAALADAIMERMLNSDGRILKHQLTGESLRREPRSEENVQRDDPKHRHQQMAESPHHPDERSRGSSGEGGEHGERGGMRDPGPEREPYDRAQRQRETERRAADEARRATHGGGEAA